MGAPNPCRFQAALNLQTLGSLPPSPRTFHPYLSPTQPGQYFAPFLCTQYRSRECRTISTHVRSPTMVLNMWPYKSISHIQSFSYLLFFSNPTPIIKLGLQQGGIGLLVATHLDQSNYLTNQHGFVRVLTNCLLATSASWAKQLQGQNYFCGEPNPHVLIVLHPIFLRWGYIYIYSWCRSFWGAKFCL